MGRMQGEKGGVCCSQGCLTLRSDVGHGFSGVRRSVELNWVKIGLLLSRGSEFLDAVCCAMGSSAGKKSNGSDWAERWAMATLLQDGLKSGKTH